MTRDVPNYAPPILDVERLARALADVGLYHLRIEGQPSMTELAELIAAAYARSGEATDA